MRCRGAVLAVAAGMGCLALGGLVVGEVLYQRPVPPARAVVKQEHLSAPGQVPVLPWPATGGGAVYVPIAGYLQSQRDGQAPIASVAKVMTAYVVLHDHPLGRGQSGPLLTMTAAEVSEYRAGLHAARSELAVTVGEQLSERQALDALLVGSANNIAGGLASWDAGSSSTFVAKMNATARALGLSTATRYTDPSGFDSATVSTAADQVRLAAAAFSDETFQEIVGQMQVALPVAGVVRNFDRLVGEGGIVGIKTGSTRAAGGCFVAAVREPVAGRSVVAFAAVLGQQGPNLINAGLDAGARLARAAAGSVVDEVLVPASTELGRLRAPWGATEPLETRADLRVLTIPGTSVDIVPSLDGRSVHAIPHTGATGAAGPPVALAGRGRLRPPSVWWRLTHS